LAVQAWGDWEYVPDELRKLFLHDARAALEAAAPHMLAGARAELVKLANEFAGAEGGTLAYTTILDGRHVMRKNAHDQLMYILDAHLPGE